MTEATALSRKNGHFSSRSRVKGRSGDSGTPLLRPERRSLRSGQKSSTSKVKGNVTSIGLAISPSANMASASPYHFLACPDSAPGVWRPPSRGRLVRAHAYAWYASNVRNQNVVLSTSLRSAAQATDCTCSGCHAKKAATAAALQSHPVSRYIRTRSKRELTVCSSTLPR